MASLDEKIKQILESAGIVVEGVTVKNKEGDVLTMDDEEDEDKDDTALDDKAEEEEEEVENEGDDTTDYSKEKEDKKNDVEVKEDFTETQYNKEHEQPGMKKRMNMEKGDSGAPKADGKIGDNGDNAKLKVGQGRKDGEGVKGSKTSGQNDDNSRNNVDKQSLPTKPMKVTVGEHMEAMFQGQELSEDFIAKASTIFEAAVTQVVEQRLAEEVEALQEDFQVKLDEAVEEVQSELVEQIDEFLTYVVEQWTEDNKVALESGIKVEMVSGFIDGLKTLFKEHYIEVPENKLDVIEEQAKEIEELKAAVVAIDKANDELVAESVTLKKKMVVESFSKGLTETQKEKFSSLCEGVEFSSEEEFGEKVKTIKENYFPARKPETQTQKTDGATAISEAKDANIGKYVEVLSSPLKFS